MKFVITKFGLNSPISWGVSFDLYCINIKCKILVEFWKEWYGRNRTTKESGHVQINGNEMKYLKKEYEEELKEGGMKKEE